LTILFPSAILPSATLPSAIHFPPSAIALQQYPFSQPPHQKNLPHPKSLTSSFSEYFIFSGKQGSGATVLEEGCDIVTRGTSVPASLNLNNLGKASELHLIFLLSSVAGAVPNLSLLVIWHK
jgi:hypothetical protein